MTSRRISCPVLHPSPPRNEKKKRQATKKTNKKKNYSKPFMVIRTELKNEKKKRMVPDPFPSFRSTNCLFTRCETTKWIVGLYDSVQPVIVPRYTVHERGFVFPSQLFFCSSLTNPLPLLQLRSRSPRSCSTKHRIGEGKLSDPLPPLSLSPYALFMRTMLT